MITSSKLVGTRLADGERVRRNRMIIWSKDGDTRLIDDHTYVHIYDDKGLVFKEMNKGSMTTPLLSAAYPDGRYVIDLDENGDILEHQCDLTDESVVMIVEDPVDDPIYWFRTYFGSDIWVPYRAVSPDDIENKDRLVTIGVLMESKRYLIRHDH